MKNQKKIIKVVDDFSPHPYGRVPDDGDACGQKFRREHLLPALNEYQSVLVILTGYNRYGRSFIDEAFGGLIRENGYKLSDLRHRLTYEHEQVKSIEHLIKERLEAAENARVD